MIGQVQTMAVRRAGHRSALPARRAHDGIDIAVGHFDYHVGIGLAPDGRLAEVFVTCAKANSDVANWARDVGILLSLALQHGVPLAVVLAAQPRLADGTPTGLVGAVLDAIAAAGLIKVEGSHG